MGFSLIKRQMGVLEEVGLAHPLGESSTAYVFILQRKITFYNSLDVVPLSNPL